MISCTISTTFTVSLYFCKVNIVEVAPYAPFTLTILPLEIIVEIMKQLDWYSLLNIRQESLRRLPFPPQASSVCCLDMQFAQ